MPFVHRPAGQAAGLVIHRSRSDVHGRAKRATALVRCATRTHAASEARRPKAGGKGPGKPRHSMERHCGRRERTRREERLEGGEAALQTDDAGLCSDCRP